MVDDFNKILDECIDRINDGESIESCLTDNSEYSKQLKPLLLATLQAKKIYKYIMNKKM